MVTSLRWRRNRVAQAGYGADGRSKPRGTGPAGVGRQLDIDTVAGRSLHEGIHQRHIQNAVITAFGHAAGAAGSAEGASGNARNSSRASCWRRPSNVAGKVCPASLSLGAAVEGGSGRRSSGGRPQRLMRGKRPCVRLRGGHRGFRRQANSIESFPIWIVSCSNVFFVLYSLKRGFLRFPFRSP